MTDHLHLFFYTAFMVNIPDKTPGNEMMSTVKRIVLDVLKPLHPNALEFATAIADGHPGCRVTVTVSEIDAKTETTLVTVEGDAIVYDDIAATISGLGASVHSIDAVEVISVRHAAD